MSGPGRGDDAEGGASVASSTYVSATSHAVLALGQAVPMGVFFFVGGAVRCLLCVCAPQHTTHLGFS